MAADPGHASKDTTQSSEATLDVDARPRVVMSATYRASKLSPEQVDEVLAGHAVRVTPEQFERTWDTKIATTLLYVPTTRSRASMRVTSRLPVARTRSPRPVRRRSRVGSSRGSPARQPDDPDPHHDRVVRLAGRRVMLRRVSFVEPGGRGRRRVGRQGAATATVVNGDAPTIAVPPPSRRRESLGAR
jgi:hypothetical protein